MADPAPRSARSDGTDRPGSTRPDTLRVHLATDPGGDSGYRLDEARFRAAGREFPEAFARLRPTYSEDEAGFYRGVRDAEVLIGWKFPRDRLAERAPNLRWIQLIGAGVDHLYPLDWLPPRVGLLTASGVHTRKCFEYALMALVALRTRLPRFVAQQQRREWGKIQTGTLEGKTALVIGLGAVGTGAAEAARALRMRVLGVRRTARPHRFVDELFPPARLAEALPRADYVLLAAPLTGETEEILGPEEIALLPRGAGIVNLGRGRLVSQPVLVEALRSGQVGGAFLDTVWPEPLPPESDLWHAPNLILTPHVGADDIDRYVPMVFRIALDNFTRFFAGRPRRNVVNRRRGY